MRKLILMIMAITMTAVISSCSRDADLDMNNLPYQDLEQTRSENNQRSEEQLALLDKLRAINDSVAGCDSNYTTGGIESQAARELSYEGQSLWKVVSSADVRGFKNGWEYGKKNGSGFFGRIKSGLIAGTMTSFVYSLSAAICYAFGWELALRPPTVEETLVATANVMQSDELIQRVEDFKLFNPDFEIEGKEDELKAAMAHNILLETYEVGTILPSGPVEEYFTPEDLSYFRSSSYGRFHRNIPSFVNGSKNFYVTYGINYDTYENEILDLYLAGLQNINTATKDQFVQKSKQLCINYISTISDSSVLVESEESNLSAAIFLMPMSVEYWSNHK